MNEPARLAVCASDGHRFELPHVPARHTAKLQLLWLPALGVPARHYLPLAQALAAHGCAVTLMEWRGHGSSQLRAGRDHDWGFHALLQHDLPAAISRLREAGIHIDTLGGHSLGGQLASCFAGQLEGCRRLWLVASGSPYWRSFPLRHRLLLPLAYVLLPAIARLCGHLPGRRLGFGGRESASLIADWARVGRSGHYRLPSGVEQQMRQLQLPCTAVCLQHDWLAPASSLSALLGKLPGCTPRIHMAGSAELGTRADHFAWMRDPSFIAATLAEIGP